MTIEDQATGLPSFTPSEMLAIGRLLSALQLGEDTIGEIMKTGGFCFVGDGGTVQLARKIDQLKSVSTPTPSDNKARDFQSRADEIGFVMVAGCGCPRCLLARGEKP